VSRVLVVDDEPLVRELIVDVLRAHGHEALVAEAADHALALLGGEGEPVALVLADHGLPGLTGLELLARVRERWPALPAILLSGGADGELRARAAAAGARAVLAKPFSPAELTGAVAAALASGA
jgi:two-component system response regulator AtoC